MFQYVVHIRRPFLQADRCLLETGTGTLNPGGTSSRTLVKAVVGSPVMDSGFRVKGLWVQLSETARERLDVSSQLNR